MLERVCPRLSVSYPNVCRYASCLPSMAEVERIDDEEMLTVFMSKLSCSYVQECKRELTTLFLSYVHNYDINSVDVFFQSL